MVTDSDLESYRLDSIFDGNVFNTTRSFALLHHVNKYSQPYVIPSRSPVSCRFSFKMLTDFLRICGTWRKTNFVICIMYQRGLIQFSKWRILYVKIHYMHAVMKTSATNLLVYSMLILWYSHFRTEVFDDRNIYHKSSFYFNGAITIGTHGLYDRKPNGNNGYDETETESDHALAIGICSFGFNGQCANIRWGSCMAIRG